MTYAELRQFFSDNADQYHRWEEVPPERRLHPRSRDLNALLLLDQLDPQQHSAVSAAAHDEFWASADPEVVAKTATEEQILDLIRCGVRLDEHDSFAFFA